MFCLLPYQPLGSWSMDMDNLQEQYALTIYVLTLRELPIMIGNNYTIIRLQLMVRVS